MQQTAAVQYRSGSNSSVLPSDIGRIGNVAALCHEQDITINRLRDAIQALAEQLQPALRPDQPPLPPHGGDPGVPPTRCRIAETIAAHNARIEELTSLVVAASTKLDL